MILLRPAAKRKATKLTLPAAHTHREVAPIPFGLIQKQQCLSILAPSRSVFSHPLGMLLSRPTSRPGM